MLPKAAPQTCSTKLLPKAILQNGSRKLLHKVATESCPPKLRSKATPLSCSPKLRFFKASVRSCRAKPLLQAAPACQSCQSCSPKLLHKAVPQSRAPKLLSKAAPNTCFPKLLSKATPQSCRSSKTVRQCCLQSRKVAPHSCSPKSPKLLSKVATCYRKPRPKEAPQNSAHRLRKQAQCVR